MQIPVLFLIAVTAGLALGYTLGGRVREFSRLPAHLLVIPWLAASLQLVLGATAEGTVTSKALLIGTYVLIVGWIVAALRATGRMVWPSLGRFAIAVLALGWAANTAVIAANGGMPVSPRALVAAGYNQELDVRHVGVRKHVGASDHTRLMLLGDAIPIRPLRRVVSAGDIAILVGFSVFVAAAMGRRRLVGPQPT